MTNARLIYVTAKNAHQAGELANALMEAELIACANILPEMQSIYRWESRLHRESEAVLILKTELALVSRAIAKIEELHPYDTPCALVLAVEAGSPAYLKWLAEQVKPALPRP